MTATSPSRRAVLIDVGGVLMPDDLTAAATFWGGRLGMPPRAFLAAVFAGSDDHVLIGRTSEVAWWRIIGYAKPDVRIYETALHRIGVDAGDALFIDDTPVHVETARSLGMTGHLHTHTGETLDRIEHFVQSQGPGGPPT